MAVCKATLLLQSENLVGRTAGWSETWYKEGVPADVMDSLKRTAPFRASFMPIDSKVIGQRVQLIGGRAITDNAVFPGAGRVTTDIPQMAAMCSVTNAAGDRKKTFAVRGIPDDAVASGALIAGGNTIIGLNFYMNNLAVNGFQWRARDLSLPAVQIVSVDALGVFRLAADMVFAVGDFFTAVRVRSQQGRSIVGNFYVSARVDAQNGTLFGWPAGQTVQLNGKFRKQAFIFPSVSAGSGKVIRVMVRKVGRPFFQYRGRATRRR